MFGEWITMLHEFYLQLSNYKMVQLSIPAVQETGWGAGWSSAASYEDVIDSSYLIYSASLKNYPVASAFVSTISANESQEKWGLQIPSRTLQNDARKTELSFNAASGATALSLHSITWPFESALSNLDTASIQTGLYLNGYATVQTIDLALWNIDNIKISGTTEVAYGSTTAGTVPQHTGARGFVCDVAWTKFLVYQYEHRNAHVVELDANYSFVSVKAVLETSNSLAAGDEGNVVGSNGAYFWTIGTEGSATTVCRLYQLDSLWQPTQIGADNVINASREVQAGSSYRLWNEIHYLSKEYASNRILKLRIDATVLTWPTLTVDQNFTTSAGFQWWTYIFWSSFDTGLDRFYATDWSGRIWSWSGATNPTEIHPAWTYGNIVSWLYINPAHGGDVIADILDYENQLFYSNGSDLVMKGNVFGTWMGNKMIFMYEWTTTGKQSDDFVGMYVEWYAFAHDDGYLRLKVNGTQEALIDPQNTITPEWFCPLFSLTDVALSAQEVDFELVWDNVNLISSRIYFGTTWGTYNAPIGNYETSSMNVTF